MHVFVQFCLFLEKLSLSLSVSHPVSLTPPLCLSLCLSLRILPLWETKLFLKKSLCMFERGEEGEAGQQMRWREY